MANVDSWRCVIITHLQLSTHNYVTVSWYNSDIICKYALQIIL